ncbi:hypothetical protein ACJX0J_008431, partial [Zea mays]
KKWQMVAVDIYVTTYYSQGQRSHFFSSSATHGSSKRRRLCFLANLTNWYKCVFKNKTTNIRVYKLLYKRALYGGI